MKKISLLTLIIALATSSVFAQLTWLPVPNAPNEVRIEDISFINNISATDEANDTIYKTTNAVNVEHDGLFPPCLCAKYWVY